MSVQILPDWFLAASREIGIRELPNNSGPAIRRYIALAHTGREGDPWCAIFANAMLESTGHPGTRSAMARSFERHPNFVKLSGPALGCIVTFWRGVKSQGFGHIGFYNGEIGDYISTVGGNESDMVREEMYPRLKNGYGFSGYYWPKGIPLPPIAPCKPYFKGSVAIKSTGKVT